MPSNPREGTNEPDNEGKTAAQNLGFPLRNSTVGELPAPARVVNEAGPGHHDLPERGGHERNG